LIDSERRQHRFADFEHALRSQPPEMPHQTALREREEIVRHDEGG